MLSSRLVPFPGRWLAIPLGKDVRGQAEGETDRIRQMPSSGWQLAHLASHRTAGAEAPGLETMDIWVHGGQACLRAKGGLER